MGNYGYYAVSQQVLQTSHLNHRFVTTNLSFIGTQAMEREFHTPDPGSSPCSAGSPSAQPNISVASQHRPRAWDLNLDTPNVPGAIKVRFLGNQQVFWLQIHIIKTLLPFSYWSSTLDHMVASRCPKLVIHTHYLPHSHRDCYIKIFSEVLQEA